MSAYLERLTWMEAERVLTPDAVVMIPLGAAAKEHGPHLPLDNDRTLAQYLARRVADLADVVIAPTLAYHFYPAFVEYPGSTTLRLETARDLVIDIVVSLASFGPRRFYVLNTGVSTVRALRPAAHALAERGIAMRFTDIGEAGRNAVQDVSEQDGGTHADEIETSMMLYIAPETVDMGKAARDFHPGSGPLTRDPGREGVYSPTGIYGDATLASVEKGAVVVEAMVRAIAAQIQALAKSSPPTPSTMPSA
jgi:creatinine amidohydrolase